MKNLKFKTKCVAVLAFILLTVFGCKKNEEVKNNSNGGDLVLGSATELNNFDPFSSITADVRSVNFNIFEGLVKVSEDGSFVPAVAESYSISDDAKTYTFTLRKGVYFHNGNEVTSDDVIYSLQKAVDAKLTNFDRIKNFYYKDQKLIIELNSSDAGFIAYLTSAIVPKDYDNLALNPIGTGPFKFAEYEEQSYIKLIRNDLYWGTVASLNSVTIKFEASQANLILSFQAGTIDGFSASADTISQLDESRINKYISNSNSVQLLALNNNFEPFNNVNVRKALNYLVDSDEIINTVNYGAGTKIGSALIPNLKKYYDETLVNVYDKNVAKAKYFLEKAGYQNGFDFTITVPSSYNVHVKTAEVIVNQLSALGINAKIKQVDWATWLQNVYMGRQFEATIISLDAPLAYPTSFLARYVSDSKSNFINFSSSTYDKVYEQASSEINEELKVLAFKKAQQILNQEAASVWIQDIASFNVYNKKFGGNKSYPLYATDYSAIHLMED